MHVLRILAAAGTAALFAAGAAPAHSQGPLREAQRQGPDDDGRARGRDEEPHHRRGRRREAGDLRVPRAGPRAAHHRGLRHLPLQPRRLLVQAAAAAAHLRDPGDDRHPDRDDCGGGAVLLLPVLELAQARLPLFRAGDLVLRAALVELHRSIRVQRPHSQHRQQPHHLDGRNPDRPHMRAAHRVHGRALQPAQARDGDLRHPAGVLHRAAHPEAAHRRPHHRGVKQ